MRKLIKHFGKFWVWLFATVFVTVVATITGAAVNQGMGDTDLLGLFLLGINWFYEGLKYIGHIVLVAVQSWIFAFLLGGFVAVLIFRLLLSKPVVADTTDRNFSFQNPSNNDIEGLTSMLRAMSDWAQVGFEDRYSFGDEAWYIDRETEIEACMEYLEAIGIFMPKEFKKLNRGQSLPGAVRHYTRIAKLLELHQLNKVREEYPKLTERRIPSTA